MDSLEQLKKTYSEFVVSVEMFSKLNGERHSAIIQIQDLLKRQERAQQTLAGLASVPQEQRKHAEQEMPRYEREVRETESAIHSLTDALSANMNKENTLFIQLDRTVGTTTGKILSIPTTNDVRITAMKDTLLRALTVYDNHLPLLHKRRAATLGLINFPDMNSLRSLQRVVDEEYALFAKAYELSTEYRDLIAKVPLSTRMFDTAKTLAKIISILAGLGIGAHGGFMYNDGTAVNDDVALTLLFTGIIVAAVSMVTLPLLPEDKQLKLIREYKQTH